MRIGILGGTFDPIHYGHLEMACCVKAFFSCDKLFLMPAYSPPHKPKQSITSPYHRYTMAAIATNDIEDIEVSRLELEAPTRPFTVQTVYKLKEMYGGNTQLFFIMGADSFRELDTWHEYSDLIANSSIVVMTRPGYELDIEERRQKLQAGIEDLRGRHEPIGSVEALPKIFVTALVERDISATAIREAAARGESIKQWVPETIARYILKYRLYQDE
jgi:nicotinate-nucleotide adenylyltransferase